MRPPRPSKLPQGQSSERGEGTLLERGVRALSGCRGFLSTACPDLVMSFNSFLATRFLPALLSGEGPLVPMPATHQFTQSPSSGVHTYTCACIHISIYPCTQVFMCTHTLSQGHETTIVFQLASLPECRGYSVSHTPLSPAAAYGTGEAQPPLLPREVLKPLFSSPI